MSEPDGVETGSWPDRALAAVFGDRRGLALFLGALVFVGCYWRLRYFSTDQFAVLNALVALADGHLAIHDTVYGSEISPGTYVADGRLYGRNYGHVVVSLPVLFALRGLSLLFDLHALLVGGWALTFLGFATVVGGLRDRRRRALVVASPVALAFFVGNVLVGEPLADRWVPLVALQLTTAVTAALLAATLYRLVARRYGARVGTAVGAAAILATPVGFWATVPKRHTIVALLVVCCLYALYRSRESASVVRATRFRALAYGSVGLTAWVHAGEALILLLALAVVDLPTAPRNRPADLAVVGGVFALSLVPFLVTNTLISGEPLTPPRLLPAAASVPPDAIQAGGPGGGGAATTTSTPTPTEPPSGTGETATPVSGAASTATPGSSGTPTPVEPGPSTDTPTAVATESAIGTSTPTQPPTETPAPSAAGTGVLSRLLAIFSPVANALDRLVFYVQRGIDTATLADLRYTFVRSGYHPGLRPGQDVAVNLSVFESMPLLGVLLAGPLLVATRLRAEFTSRERGTLHALTAWLADRSIADLRDRLRLSPARTTEVFAVAFALLLAGVTLQRLPTHHMVTVRYLHPVYPLGLYLLVGLPAVRGVVAGRPRSLVGSYVATVGFGVPGYVAFLTLGNPVLGEAVQAFALASLTAAVAVAGWAAVAAARGRPLPRTGAVVLGVAAGLVTTYLLVSGIALFAVERAFFLPWAEAVSEWIRFGASGV